MFRTIQTGSEWTLENSEGPVFRLGAFTLHPEQGDAVPLPLNTLRAKEENDWRCETLSDPDGNALEFRFQNGLAALTLRGGLPQKEPPFGAQPGLAPDGGLRLRLLPEGSGPLLSLYQHKEWWMRPAFAADFGEIPGRSQLVLQKTDGGCRVFLAVCGRRNRADLIGVPGGGLELSLSSNLSAQREMDDLALVFAEGDDPYSCVEDAVRAALTLTGKPALPRARKPFPRILESLGWCTWDSLGKDVDEAAIFRKLDELRAKNVPVRWVLIDDGWSQANRATEQLTGLDADRRRFPDGLAATVRRIKAEYGIESVGVWQAIRGYWNGVEEGSPAAAALGPYLRRFPNGELAPDPEPSAAFGFWNTWHAYLQQQGVDFVKVDSQSTLSITCHGSYAFGEAAQAVHTGLEASAAIHFGGALINCMGMAPEDIWNRPAASLSRNSDDFVPRTPRGFCEHALQNGFNSLLHGCFYWGDWDMFWTRHEESRQNALLRAVSGGPVYISDGLGQTEPAALLPLALENGRVLRCRDVGKPTLDCLFVNPISSNQPLKIFNRYGGVFFVAAFSIGNAEAEESGTIGPDDIPALRGRRCWLYDWEAKRARLLAPGERHAFCLPQHDAAFFQLLPCDREVTPLGLTDKYLSAAGIKNVLRTPEETAAELHSGGTFAFLTENRTVSVQVDGVPVRAERDGDLYRVPCTGENPVVSIRTRRG